MKQLLALFTRIFSRLSSIESRLAKLESKPPAGPTVVLSGKPQINR